MAVRVGYKRHGGTHGGVVDSGAPIDEVEGGLSGGCFHGGVGQHGDSAPAGDGGGAREGGGYAAVLGEAAVRVGVLGSCYSVRTPGSQHPSGVICNHANS